MPSGHICFSSPRRERHHPGAIALIFLLATGALAGCSMTDGIGSYIVDPGEYHVFHCDDLKKRLATLLDQQKELSNFINKASESAGGVIIGNSELSVRLRDCDRQGEAFAAHGGREKMRTPPTCFGCVTLRNNVSKRSSCPLAL